MNKERRVESVNYFIYLKSQFGENFRGALLYSVLTK